MSNERQVLLTEYQDTQSELTKQYQLTYYPYDCTIEIYDLKLRKQFLKRIEYKSIKLNDLFIGAIVTIHSRQQKITDYGDVQTSKQFEVIKGRSIVVIKPEGFKNVGNIITLLEKNDFRISKLKMVRFDSNTAHKLLSNDYDGNNLSSAVDSLISEPSIILEVIGTNCTNTLNSISGPLNPQNCNKNTIRGKYGSSMIKNVLQVSKNQNVYHDDNDLLFNNRYLEETAQFTNCTACVIKPHVLYNKKLGEAIQIILNEGFEISAIELFNLDLTTSEEFLEVQKGVVPEQRFMVEHLSEGPCIAMEIRQQDAVNSFRELCGPHDPDVAKYLRPKTLRALFGEDRVKNGVHATDLEEDGTLEVDYFFNILQKY